MIARFRRLLLASAPLTAGILLASPVMAADIIEEVLERTISGTFEKYVSYSALDGSEIDESSNEADDFLLAGGIARVDVPFSENWSLQSDLEAEGAFSNEPQDADDSSIEDTYSGGIIGASHLNYRQVDQYLFGVFGGGGKAYIDDTDGTDGISPDLYFVGVEGQLYLGNTTLYAQGGFFDTNALTDASEEGDFIEDAFFVRGVARHFFSENTMLRGEVSYASGDEADDGDDIRIIGWGARLEHQFATWGTDDGYMSLFVEYRGSHFDQDEGVSPEQFAEHAGLIGVKFALNQGSLLSNDRLGATLDLPRFGWWVGESPASD